MSERLAPPVAETVGQQCFVPDIRISPEAPEKRQHAIHTMYRAIDLLQFTDPDMRCNVRELSDHQRWTVQAVRTALAEVNFKEGKDTFKRKWTDQTTGKTYTLQEGVPVDDLLHALQNLNPPGTIDSDQQLLELLERNSLLHTLHDYAIPFDELNPNLPEDVFESRVRLEAGFIANDFRNTGNPESNYALARNTLESRLEFRPTRDFILEERTKQSIESFLQSPHAADDDRKDVKPKVTPRQIAYTIVEFGYPTAVAISLLGHEKETIAAGALAAALTRGALYAKEKNGRIRPSDAKEIGKATLLPAAGIIVGSPALVDFVNNFQGEIKGYVESGLLYGAAAASLHHFKEWRDSQKKEKDPLLDLTDPLDRAHDAAEKALLFVIDTDHEPRARLQNLKARVSRRQEAKISESVAGNLFLSVLATGEKRAQLAFMRYEALLSFLHYTSLLDPENARLDCLEVKGKAIEAMDEIEELAMAAIVDPQAEFGLSDEEFTEFQRYLDYGHGLRYLLYTTAGKASGDRQRVTAEKRIAEIKAEVLGATSSVPSTVDEHLPRLRRISKKQKRWVKDLARNVAIETDTAASVTETLLKHARRHMRRF